MAPVRSLVVLLILTFPAGTALARQVERPERPGRVNPPTPAPEDTPRLITRGVDDRTGVLTPAAKTLLEGKLNDLATEGECQLAIVLLPGAPREWARGFAEPQLFAVRSFFVAHPRTEGAEDSVYFADLEAHPAAVLVGFVSREDEQSAEFGYFGASSCLNETTGIALIHEVRVLAYPEDAAAALTKFIEYYVEARGGRWYPPTPTTNPTPESEGAAPATGLFSRFNGIIGAFVNFRPLGIPVGTAVGFFLFAAILALPLRCLPIIRRVRHGTPFWRAWLYETFILMMYLRFFSSSSSTSSSGSSRSSYRGGGGSFGGGGASGSW